MTPITFFAPCKPQPQGSIKSFLLPDKVAILDVAQAIHRRPMSLSQVIDLITTAAKKTRSLLTTDNPELKAYRKQVTGEAARAIKLAGLSGVMAGHHIPVAITLEFHFVKPPSVPKKRQHPVVKPDIDKLARATLDALTSVIYEDDAQVCCMQLRKQYGPREGVHVTASIFSGFEQEDAKTDSLFPDPAVEDYDDDF